MNRALKRQKKEEARLSVEPRQGSPEHAAHFAKVIKITARSLRAGNKVQTEYQCLLGGCGATFQCPGGFHRGFHHFFGKVAQGKRKGQRVRLQ